MMIRSLSHITGLRKFQGGGLAVPITPGTLGTFSPVQAPQPQPINVPNPLDITNLFRAQQTVQGNRRLDQIDRTFDEQVRQFNQNLDLQNRRLQIEAQDALFDDINSLFSESYVDGIQTRTANNQASMGIDSSVYDKDLSTINNYIDEAQNQAAAIYSGVGSDPSRVGEAREELNRIKTNLQRNLRDKTRLAEIKRNEEMFNLMNDSIYKQQSQKGLDVNQLAYQEILNKRQANAEKGVPLSPLDFNPSNVLFDRDAGRTKLNNAVKNAIIGNQSVEFLTAEDNAALKGFMAKATTQTQRDAEVSAALAHGVLKSDPDFRGVVSNIVARQNEENPDTPVSFDEVALSLIENEMKNLRLDENNRIIEASVHALPKGAAPGDPTESPAATTYERYFGEEPVTEKERIVNAIMTDFESQGFNLATSGRTGLLKIGSVPPRDLEFKYIDGDGNEVPADEASRLEVYQKAKEGLDENTGEPHQPRLLAYFDKQEVVTANELIPISDALLRREGLNISLKEGSNHALTGRALDVLSTLPSQFNVPELTLTSTHRDEHTNRAVGGSPNSAHKSGNGVDFRTHNDVGKTFAEWVTASPEGAEWLKQNGYTADWEDRGEENEHLHIEPSAMADVPYSSSSSTRKDVGDLSPEDMTIETTSKPEVYSKYVADRLIAGDDVSDEELDKLIVNPPASLRKEMREVQEVLREQDEIERRIEDLQAIADVHGLNEDEWQELQQLLSQSGRVNAPRSDRMRKALVRSISTSPEYRGEVLSEMFKDAPVYEDTELSVRDGEKLTLPSGDPLTNVYGIDIKPAPNDRYVVMLNRRGGARSFGFENERKVWTRSELGKFLQQNAGAIEDESISQLFLPEDVEERMAIHATKRIEDKEKELVKLRDDKFGARSTGTAEHTGRVPDYLK